MIHEIGQIDHGNHRYRVLVLDLLDRRGTAVGSPFLAIERKQDARRYGTGPPDDINGLADRRARGDYIIDDQYAPPQGAAHDTAALAVILGLLAVEGKRHIATA